MRCWGFTSSPHSLHCKVVLLDQQELIQEITDASTGQELLDTVFKHLNLLETAYFGLRYLDATNQTHWLEPQKKVSRQLRGTSPYTLYFSVKFYAADPCKLVEEITRYQFFLQVKQDILHGRLPVSFELAAELGALSVQSELGDYDSRRHGDDSTYVAEFRLAQNQNTEMEEKIYHLHKGLRGQVPSTAEMRYLDKVKWLDMYGVDLHPVLGEDNIEYFLGLTPSGIIVLRNKTKVGNYFWPRISKVKYKGRYFMLRVRDKNNDERTFGFETPSRAACKHLWKCSVEHHVFFRLTQSTGGPKSAAKLIAFPSRFGSGMRTQKEAEEEVAQRSRPPPQVSRTPSRRHRRVVEGAIDPSVSMDEMCKENIEPERTISIPQPVSAMFRSGSLPKDLPGKRGSESPRSTRSAPWSEPRPGGLYTPPSDFGPAGSSATSPHSLRLHRRTASLDSDTSVESGKKRHRSRRGSTDAESDGSKSYSRSQNRGHHSRESSTDSSHSKHRHRRKHKGSYELVDSLPEYRGGQTAVVRDLTSPRRSGYMHSGMESESEASFSHRRKQRKHRSRSRSPSENKLKVPEELRKHIELELVDPSGLSEDQKKSIPFIKVDPKTQQAVRNHDLDSPPPPYTPSPTNVKWVTASPASSIHSGSARRTVLKSLQVNASSTNTNGDWPVFGSTSHRNSTTISSTPQSVSSERPLSTPAFSSAANFVAPISPTVFQFTGVDSPSERVPQFQRHNMTEKRNTPHASSEMKVAHVSSLCSVSNNSVPNPPVKGNAMLNSIPRTDNINSVGTLGIPVVPSTTNTKAWQPIISAWNTPKQTPVHSSMMQSPHPVTTSQNISLATTMSGEIIFAYERNSPGATISTVPPVVPSLVSMTGLPQPVPPLGPKPGTTPTRPPIGPKPASATTSINSTPTTQIASSLDFLEPTLDEMSTEL